MAFTQTFVTHCEDCGEEVESRTANLTDDPRIIVDFLESVSFECDNCGATTYLEIDKYTG